MKKQKILSEWVNLRNYVIASILFVIGILLLIWAGDKVFWANNTNIQSFIETLGSTLLVTGIITVAWDLIGKRAFTEEILSKVSISQALMQAGIIHVFPSDKNREIDWDDLFQKAIEIDLLFYGSSWWRNQNFKNLESFITRKNTRMRVILPDPDDSQTMLESSRRINTTVENEIRIITDAIKDFKILVEQHPTANVEIWLLKKSPLFSAFRFGNRAVFSPYSHRASIVGVPTIICVENGVIFKFIEGELNSIFNDKNTTRKLTISPDST
ncbi:MAG: hypothetical protein H6653_07765 [Ardenticatenaceae bacterium]|nr:hypothetical protein [Ardenticatenaceae bacterium]